MERDVPGFRLNADEGNPRTASTGQFIRDRGRRKIMGGEQTCLNLIPRQEPPVPWRSIEFRCVDDEEMRRLQGAGGGDEHLRCHMAFVDGEPSGLMLL